MSDTSLADPQVNEAPPVEVDVSRKSYRDILREEITSGRTELNRPSAGLFLSGLSAGPDIGFGRLLMAVMLTLSVGRLDPLVNLNRRSARHPQSRAA